jgi:hypothetical protein
LISSRRLRVCALLDINENSETLFSLFVQAMQHEKLTLSMTRPCSHRFSEGVGSSRHLKRKRRTHPNSVRALFFIYFSCPIVFRFIVEDAVVHLYFKYDSSPAKVNNVLVFNKIAIVPTSNISDWAKARSLHPPKKRSKLALLSPQEVQMSSKQVLRIADRELLFIVEAIRTRGAAVHLRELQAASCSLATTSTVRIAT